MKCLYCVRKRRKKRILQCYRIMTMKAKDNNNKVIAWDKERLYIFLNQIIVGSLFDKRDICIYIADCYEGKSECLDPEEQRAWKLLIEVLTELYEKECISG